MIRRGHAFQEIEVIEVCYYQRNIPGKDCEVGTIFGVFFGAS